MFNWITIFYGLVLATIDTIALPILKGVHDKGWARWLLAIPIGLYAIDPMIFYSALGNESLTIMNLVWDLMSDVIVTAVGLFFFKETIPFTKMLGVGLSFISLGLMSYEGK
jgi:drug/metabolite transporter (DMT)-like permease